MIDKADASQSRHLLRILLLAAIATVVCALSLRFHFPHYFDPFAVFHIDHYVYAGMQHEGVLSKNRNGARW